MALLAPIVSEEFLLGVILGQETPLTTFEYKLFVNNYTPVAGSDVGDFTEMTTAGYAPISVGFADWTVTNAMGVTYATAADIEWTFTATGSVYGYYVVDGAGTQLVWAERFAAPVPYNYGGAGGTLTLTPYIALT